MSVRTFFIGVGIVLIAGMFWGIYVLTHLWNEQKIGEFEARQNALTGIVQVKVDNEWKTPFENDQYAPALTAADFKRVTLLDVAWGRNGLLCGRALIAPGPPIQGRLAFSIKINDIAWKKHIKDRELRETVDWQGGSLNPFVLRTGLSSPSEKNQKTFLTLQPTLYSGD